MWCCSKAIYIHTYVHNPHCSSRSALSMISACKDLGVHLSACKPLENRLPRSNSLFLLNISERQEAKQTQFQIGRPWLRCAWLYHRICLLCGTFGLKLPGEGCKPKCNNLFCFAFCFFLTLIFLHSLPGTKTGLICGAAWHNVFFWVDS